jgi:N utilization substance protein B
MGTRRLAREQALQILYQWDLRRENLETTIETFWEANTSGENERDFTERLVEGVVEHLEDIDQRIVRIPSSPVSLGCRDGGKYRGGDERRVS